MPAPNKVLILGAGASYGHGDKSPMKPPLAKSFFRIAFGQSFSTQYASLFHYLSEYVGLPKKKLQAKNLEAVFAMVEPLWRMQLIPDNPVEIARKYGKDFVWVSPLKMLQSLTVDVIWQTTSWLREHTCPFHDALVTGWLEAGDVVLDFNYDLIMDSSLANAGGKWHESTGYGWVTDVAGLSDEVKSSTVRLFKPHGSLNWFPQRPLVSEDPPFRIRVVSVRSTLDGIWGGADHEIPPKLAPLAIDFWGGFLVLQPHSLERIWRPAGENRNADSLSARPQPASRKGSQKVR